jgi:N-acetylmuramoyl-L-alanine amidase
LFCYLLFLLPAHADADVELSVQGQKPQLIREVYNYAGAAYLALDDVLPAIRLSGYWHSTQHIYSINLPGGKATLYPGGPYMKYRSEYIMLDAPARFIDGRLRVSEQFVLNQLADQLPFSIYYRNLGTSENPSSEAKNEQDRLFSFLLSKQHSQSHQQLRGVALDPAHGGDDVGVIGVQGVKEKDLVLSLALDLRRQIKMQLGIPVYLSRNEDYTLQSRGRLAVARDNPVDLFLVLHAQAALNPNQHGIHLYVQEGDPAQALHPDSSISLALHLRRALRSAGFRVREIGSTDLLSLPGGDLPTVLIELGYLSNVADAENLTEESARQRLAAALINGMQNFNRELTAPLPQP